MRKLFFLILLMPFSVSAQLIFDYGIGAQAGVFRFSEDRRFYEADTLGMPGLHLDSTERFIIKPPDGFKFGLHAMTSCTLTSPDRGYFLTATLHFVAQFGRMNTYVPNFIHGVTDPNIKWEASGMRKDMLAYFSLPLMINGNYALPEEGNAIFAGFGVSYGGYAIVDGPAEIFFVTDNPYAPGYLESYSGYYIPRRFIQFETRAGLIWTGVRGNQNEMFVHGSFGAGKMRSIQLGYLFRFNFYRGD